jgi:hypothetical protein
MNWIKFGIEKSCPAVLLNDLPGEEREKQLQPVYGIRGRIF